MRWLPRGARRRRRAPTGSDQIHFSLPLPSPRTKSASLEVVLELNTRDIDVCWSSTVVMQNLDIL